MHHSPEISLKHKKEACFFLSHTQGYLGFDWTPVITQGTEAWTSVSHVQDKGLPTEL